jgi:hypothetical protein
VQCFAFGFVVWQFGTSESISSLLLVTFDVLTAVSLLQRDVIYICNVFVQPSSASSLGNTKLYDIKFQRSMTEGNFVLGQGVCPMEMVS